MKNRRTILKAGLLAGGGLLFAGGNYYRQQQNARKAAGQWALFLDYSDLARATGRSLLKQTPEWQSLSVVSMLEQFLQRLQIKATSLQAMSNDELLAFLQARVRMDFIEESVVFSDGWLLSKTEAQLCVLASLSDGLDPEKT